MVTTKRKFYVYYDKKTGAILSATNEKSVTFDHGIEVEFEDIESLLDGTADFKDYVVGYKRLADNSTVLSVLPSGINGYTFRNNIFEWISENPTADCIVEWNGKKELWAISLNPKSKKLYTDYILTSKLVFFVTLENDLDFLIRTIYVDLQQLLDSDSIEIPFTTTLEHKINNISISSKLVFKSYGLKVTHE